MEKSKQTEKPAQPEQPVTQFYAKLNKYGSLHITKKAIPYLPFKVESPLVVRIEGNKVTIEAEK